MNHPAVVCQVTVLTGNFGYVCYDWKPSVTLTGCFKHHRLTTLKQYQMIILKYIDYSLRNNNAIDNTTGNAELCQCFRENILQYQTKCLKPPIEETGSRPLSAATLHYNGT